MVDSMTTRFVVGLSVVLVLILPKKRACVARLTTVENEDEQEGDYANSALISSLCQSCTEEILQRQGYNQVLGARHLTF
jgi:hypothetical protein